MATTHRTNEEQAPSPEEINELVRRIQERAEGCPDVREHGALTIEDMAEATGASPDVVRRHLERIREEKAITSDLPKPRSQWPMAGLAIGLFATAFLIYKVTPRPLTDADMEQMLRDARARRASLPKTIHYPIVTKMAAPSPLPPRGFRIEFRGRYTTTMSESAGTGRILSVPEAEEQLAQAFAAAYEKAVDAETSAPRPTKPLPVPPWGGPAEDHFLVSLGNTGSQLPNQVPPEIASGDRHRWFLDQARQTAKFAVEMAAKSQEEAVKTDAPRHPFQVTMGPPGYSLEFSGRRRTGITGIDLKVLPMDPDRAAAQMKKAIRELLAKDLEPPEYGTPEMKAADAKIETPAYSQVAYSGPLGRREFKVPSAPSPQYPTVADVMRGADDVLRREMERLKGEVRRLNKGGGVDAS